MSAGSKRRIGFFRSVRLDIRAAMERDPAARGAWDVFITYPGWKAAAAHRFAQRLWRMKLRLPAKFAAACTRFFTGIEIHPAAKIGPGLFIDHGMGVVIGETAEIGENVTLYHGVLLGGRSLQRTKRHPTVGDNAVIGAGAAILGPVTIGERARIGAGSVVVKDVPPDSVVVGVPGRVTFRDGEPTQDKIDLDHDNLPDPVVNALECLLERVSNLEEQVERMRGEKKKEGEEIPHPYDQF